MMFRLLLSLAATAALAMAQDSGSSGRASVSFFRFANCSTEGGPPAITSFVPGQCQVVTDATGSVQSYTITCPGGNGGTTTMCNSNDCRSNCRSQSFTNGQCQGAVSNAAAGSAASVQYNCPTGGGQQTSGGGGGAGAPQRDTPDQQSGAAATMVGYVAGMVVAAAGMWAL